MNYSIIIAENPSLKILGKSILDETKRIFSIVTNDIKVIDNSEDIIEKRIEEGITLITFSNLPFIDEKTIKELIDFQTASNNDISIEYGNLDSKYFEYFHQNDVSRILCINNKLLNELALKNVTFNMLVSNEIISSKSIYEVDSIKLVKISNLYQLSYAEEVIQNRINKAHMLNGVRITSPSTVRISPGVIINSGSTIMQGSVIAGKTIIGKNCIIGPNSEIVDSVIENNVLCEYSVVRNSTIKNNAHVGPYSHLRMNTVIGEEDRIGNFVEIKNSIIGPLTNVSHLTYVGDTDCGGGVNWGCGCVTVNYDGRNKNRTKIGDNVFIGCNTNLIAPVSIGDNSFIAAGSTITESISFEDFAIARSKQITKKGYAIKYNFKKKYGK